MYKKCTRCRKTKHVSKFQANKTKSHGRADMCRECKREYDRAYYSNNPARQAYVKRRRNETRKKIHAFICTYLSTHPCVDCGEKDPVVLEFDHVRGEKVRNVSELKTSSLRAVQCEIKKCVVRCANCHRKKTARQLKWGSKAPA